MNLFTLLTQIKPQRVSYCWEQFIHIYINCFLHHYIKFQFRILLVHFFFFLLNNFFFNWVWIIFISHVNEPLNIKIRLDSFKNFDSIKYCTIIYLLFIFLFYCFEFRFTPFSNKKSIFDVAFIFLENICLNTFLQFYSLLLLDFRTFYD